MWFKNAYVFAFTRPFTIDQLALNEKLAEQKFTHCMSTEQSRFGFTTALGDHGDLFCHVSGGNYLICARKEEKLLPAQVVKDLVDERVTQQSIEYDRRLTRKEKEQIKDDVITESLPRAFSRFTNIHAYINPEENIIVIDTSSRSKAEDFLALLRKALGTLPVTTPSPDLAPGEIMTQWLTEGCSDIFSLGCEAELHALGDDGAIVRVKNQDFQSDEMKAHLDADKCVVKCAMGFDGCMSFIFCDDMSFKRLKFFDVLVEQNDDIDTEDVLDKLDADFTLMASELNRMIKDIFITEFDIDVKQYAVEE